MVYVRYDIKSRITECENLPSSLEGLVIELSFNVKNGLRICSHNLHINSTKEHMRVLLCCLDQNIQKYENIILMGDYNAEITENMEKKPTCFKTPAKPTCIDLIINKPGMFQNVKTYETGLSDFHKLVVSIRKLSYKKRPPRMIKYRDCTNFSNEHFKNSLYEKLTMLLKKQF